MCKECYKAMERDFGGQDGVERWNETEWCGRQHTAMLVATSDKGLRVSYSHNYVVGGGASYGQGWGGYEPKEIAAFLKKQMTTMGFTIQFVRLESGRVMRVMAKGRLGERKVQKLHETFLKAEDPIVEWFYSDAFSPRNFRLPGGRTVGCAELDLTSDVDWLEAYARGFSLDLAAS